MRRIKFLEVFIMSKIKDFLKETSEISNGDRLTIVAGVAIMWGVGLWFNKALNKTNVELFKSEMRNQDLMSENELLNWRLENKEKNEFEEED